MLRWPRASLLREQLCIHFIVLQSRVFIAIPHRYARLHKQAIALALHVFGSLVGCEESVMSMQHDLEIYAPSRPRSIKSSAVRMLLVCSVEPGVQSCPADPTQASPMATKSCAAR